MERKDLAVCSVVAILGLLLVATGFAAEGTRVKLDQVIQGSPSTTCKYPRSPAMGLGLTAALSLLLAQITINISTGCICCTRGPRPPAAKWRTAVICFVISWFTFVVAFLLLIAGAALNDQRGEHSYYFGDYYECYVLKPGVFAVATVVGTASLALGLYYYLILNSAKNDPAVWSNPSVPPQVNIVMGQPQFPPPPPPQRPGDPVFVHEDTYMRRQYT